MNATALNSVKGRLQLSDRQWNVTLALLILALFVIFNKGAFQSYFSDDDLMNLAVFEPWWGLLKALFSLALQPLFRPVGVIFYKAMGSLVGFHFSVYVAVLQVLHVATGFLLWSFIRRLGIRPVAAALGGAFFLLHMAALPAYWKPMYIFDVLCGFWVISALLLYQRKHFFLSLLCAWLAFKSKESELMLPAVLLLYEWLFGREENGGKLRWQPLIPFFLMSLSFGLQSLLLPLGPETDYSVHFTPANVWTGIVYYSGKLFYAPFSGLIISIGLLFLRQRLVTWGVLGFWILLTPMFAFPARQSGAYLYVPLLLFAAAVARTAEVKPLWASLFLAIWIPASYEQLSIERKPIIAFHYDHRPYITQIVQSLKEHPKPSAVVYEGTPNDLYHWGQYGLFRFALQRYDLPVYSTGDPDARQAIRRPTALLFTWDDLHRVVRTSSFPGDGHEMSYIDFGQDNPFWQLKTGWKPLSGDCRWTELRSVIALRQEKGDLSFSMRIEVTPDQADRVHPTVRVSVDRQPIGEQRLDRSGFQTLSWPVSSSVAAVRDFEITVDRATHLDDGREGFGVRVCGCGLASLAK